MSEARIISMISLYGCLILANTSDITIIAWIWLGLAIISLIRYIYLVIKD